jgi:hypothetical protein
MDEHTSPQKDLFVRDELEHMLLLIPTNKKRKTITDTRSVAHPYTSRLADVLRAIYPATLTDEATPESKELFCCWWRSLAVAVESKRAICAFLVSVGTHLSYTDGAQDISLYSVHAQRPDEAYITRMWKNYMKHGDKCKGSTSSKIGNPYDRCTLQKAHFRNLLRALDLIRTTTSDGKLTMENGIAFCRFDDLFASHGSRIFLLKITGFEHMSDLVEEFQKVTVRNNRFLRVKLQLGDKMPTTDFDFVKEMKYVEGVSGCHISNIQACTPGVLLKVINGSCKPIRCYSIISGLLQIRKHRSKNNVLKSQLDVRYTKISRAKCVKRGGN